MRSSTKGKKKRDSGGRALRSLALILMVFALIAAACGSDDDDTSTDATTTTAAPADDDDADAATTTAAPADDDAETTTAAPADEMMFEGVTLKFAKAPHGEDEQDNMETWLAAFEEETGINVEHTVVPWDNLEATYTASFAGNDGFDVSYQTSTHLSLFGEFGALKEVSEEFNGAEYADERAHFSDGIVDASSGQSKGRGHQPS